jgi:hypothetical protein
VVIHVIDIKGVMVGKAENDAPVRTNDYCPKAFLPTFEGMQPETRHVHIGDGRNSVETRENVAEFVTVFGYDATRVVVFVKALQSLMA